MPTEDNLEVMQNEYDCIDAAPPLIRALKAAFTSCLPFLKGKFTEQQTHPKHISNRKRTTQENATIYTNQREIKQINNSTDIPLSDISEKYENPIQLHSIDAKIDNILTRIDESSSKVIKYRTPNFRASATIRLAPSTRSESWKIGWIQACTKMVFRNTYGEDGYTSWEFQELNSKEQPMISDCDGCYYPWYGARDETVIFCCPSQKTQEATLVMNDNFHPHVTWRNPADEAQTAPNLTNIVRNQSFYVWLLAWNMTSEKSYILTNISWSMDLEININPQRKLGERARLVSPRLPQQPIVLKDKIAIPRCALSPPNANSAQRLVWNPTQGNPEIIIPPVWNKKKSVEGQVQKYDSKL